jgi:hypothetical protein
MTGAKDATEAWYDMLKKMGIPVNEQVKEIFRAEDFDRQLENVMKLNMLMNPYVKHEVNLDRPIDPDRRSRSQMLTLLNDIENDVRTLRELIRGRE